MLQEQSFSKGCLLLHMCPDPGSCAKTGRALGWLPEGAEHVVGWKQRGTPDPPPVKRSETSRGSFPTSHPALPPHRQKGQANPCGRGKPLGFSFGLPGSPCVKDLAPGGGGPFAGSPSSVTTGKGKRVKQGEEVALPALGPPGTA